MNYLKLKMVRWLVLEGLAVGVLAKLKLWDHFDWHEPSVTVVLMIAIFAGFVTFCHSIKGD